MKHHNKIVSIQPGNDTSLDQTVLSRLAALKEMSVKELKAEWEKLIGTSATRMKNHHTRPPMRANSRTAPTQRDVFMARILGTRPLPARRRGGRFAILYRSAPRRGRSRHRQAAN